MDVQEALSYQSNKDMSLQGAWIGFTPLMNGALCMNTQSDEAVYVSDVFDCGEAKGTWDELHLHFEHLWELQVSVWMFDSDSTREQLLEFSTLDRFHVIKQNGFTKSKQDLLLYGMEEKSEGRYLVFCFLVRKPKGNTLQFVGYELSYPAVLFSEYLPYVYRNNPTLDAYLSIFKDVYLFLEQEIDSFYEQLDPLCADEAHLRELLTWLGLEHFQEYAELSALRGLPALWNRIYQEKGSLYYLLELVKFLFHIDVCMRVRKRTLHVFAPCLPVDKKHKLLSFFQQEVSANAAVHVHFTRQSYMDENAFLGVTAGLREADRVMDTAEMDRRDIMK